MIIFVSCFMCLFLQVFCSILHFFLQFSSTFQLVLVVFSSFFLNSFIFCIFFLQQSLQIWGGGSEKSSDFYNKNFLETLKPSGNTLGAKTFRVIKNLRGSNACALTKYFCLCPLARPLVVSVPLLCMFVPCGGVQSVP